MPFNFAAAKSLVRRVVNETLGVQAFYKDALVNTPIETRARLQNRISKPFGGPESGAGYAEIIEGVDRIVLIPVDVQGYPLDLKRGGIFTFPETHPGEEFILELQEPNMGPLEVSWQVARK